MSFTLKSGRIEDLDAPEAQLHFIKAQWRDFAAFAWEKYSAEGRGAIVVDLRKAAKSSAGLSVPVYYVADGSARLSARGGWPTEEVAEVIRDYDPRQDVVFIFLRLAGDLFHYNVSDEPTPPQAYEAKQQDANSAVRPT